MSDPILPPGIRVGSGLGVDERPVVRLDLVGRVNPDGAEIAVAVVLRPRQMRALCALMMRQCDLVERRDLGDGA